jgi:hypothetical protein
MDPIVAPHLRPDTLLNLLQGNRLEKNTEAQLDEHDLNWINNAISLSVEGGEVLKRDFGVGE